ncbi:response regulator transcription factor [Micromonospora sp. DSM 115977]|uniref:Response regulator transcription factor n=1 Tax=Micromonospora reichwaldensis TaxID=3075516 RepID=A0ABU2X0A2_9ACTN|nr:response regulator transcription factor [Micromonospora sp. DSM 115977]MDT0531215.1 response regulator transcription factor [Micromonospora sp. DSM 115977]
MRAVLADDSVLLRSGLALLLQQQGITVVAEVGDGEQLLAAVAEHQPDVAIVDIRMPPSFTVEGVRAALAVRRRYPGVAVLLLSQHLEHREALALLQQPGGGVGYLLKDRITDVAGFLRDVRRVAASGTAIDPIVVDRLLRRPRVSVGVGALSPREREILARMAAGRANRGISAELHLSERTVETHVRSIFVKLGLADEPDTHRRVLAVLTFLAD